MGSSQTDHQNGWTIHYKLYLTASLKTRGSCSLNEAAYPGVNLMNDLLGLLLFKTNKYVLLADTRKAVLIIKLNSDNDKNRLFFFVFFLKEGDKLLCLRYTTLIYGLNASLFIFLYVPRHYVEKFWNVARCRKIISTWTMYVKPAIHFNYIIYI